MMTRWKRKQKKKTRPVFEIIPVKYGSNPAHVLNGKTVKTDPKKNPLGLKFFLDTDKIDMPKGWYQTSTACPMQYSKIVRIGKDYYEGYLRSRHDSPFSIEIILLYRNWKTRDQRWKKWDWWTRMPVDTCDDNPPTKSMKLINRKFSKMVKEFKDGKA